MSLNIMTATFEVEGFGYGSPTVPEGPSLVAVNLATDGNFVWVVQSHTNFGLPKLTPAGWYQLANKANDLKADANDAWQNMGSKRE